MSTISAGTSSGTALVSTGDTSGNLELQSSGVTKLTVGSGGVTLASALPVASGGTGAASLTANNVLLGNGTSALQVVAPGTNGNVLTSNGTTWASTAPVTGAMVYLASVSASASSTIDLFDYFSSTYDTYFITANGIYMSASNWLQIRIRTGTTVQTGSSYSSWSNATGSSYNAAFGIIFEGSPTASTDQTSFYCYITNPNSTTQHKAIYGYAGSYTSTAVSSPVANFNAVWRGDTNALTGVRIYPAAGTITAGTFRLYGIKNS